MQPPHSEDTVTNSHKLSLVPLQKALPQTSPSWDFLVKQCDRLYQFFVQFAATSQEPKVTWKRNQQGRSHFEIYDPSTEKYHYFDSEQDALIWLDRDRFGSALQSRRQQFTKSYEKLPDKNLKSFDYFGRH